MKLAFYKAYTFHGTWKEITLDVLIGIFSFGRHSHVELVFPNGQSFSISARDKSARFKKINFNEKRWDFIEFDASPKEVIAMKNECLRLIGKEYDYLGALFSITVLCIQRTNKIFCTEAVIKALRKMGTFSDLKDGCRFSPSRLYKTMIKKVVGYA